MENRRRRGMGRGRVWQLKRCYHRGHLRVSPTPSQGLYPFLNGRDIYESISLVSFSGRASSGGGEFYDFTARYGALRESDKVTLREAITNKISAEQLPLTLKLAVHLDLTTLLDLPLISLSNGQTRRAKILEALMKQPKLIVLDEPFTGLDASQRPKLDALLEQLHRAKNPRTIIALRPQDPIPHWISHVMTVSSKLQSGPIANMQAALEKQRNDRSLSKYGASQPHSRGKRTTAPMVRMRDVNISYKDRKVLKNISWDIHPGDRWHLQGSNGSGKTTLTSLLNGTHPQSYTQSHLHLFSKPRAEQPTAILQKLVGHVSPELFAAFPRNRNLTVREAIASGFDGNYVYRKRTAEEDVRIEQLTSSFSLGPSWLSTPFVQLPSNFQSLALLLRALAPRPPLLILDEVFAGMDDGLLEKARRYLREELSITDQAVVFVGHWESEVPWSIEEGLKVMRLEDGEAVFEGVV